MSGKATAVPDMAKKEKVDAQPHNQPDQDGRKVDVDAVRVFLDSLSSSDDIRMSVAERMERLRSARSKPRKKFNL